MMDSQDKTPIEEQTVGQNVVETAAEQPQETVAVTEQTLEKAETEERKQYQNKKEVLERVRELAHGDETPQKD